jgi:hypothetical protein
LLCRNLLISCNLICQFLFLFLVLPLLGIYLKECKSAYNLETCTTMFIAALLIKIELWNQPRFQSTNEWMKIFDIICMCIYIYMYIYIYIYTYTHTHTHIYICIYIMEYYSVVIKRIELCHFLGNGQNWKP